MHITALQFFLNLDNQDNFRRFPLKGEELVFVATFGQCVNVCVHKLSLMVFVDVTQLVQEVTFVWRTSSKHHLFALSVLLHVFVWVTVCVCVVNLCFYVQEKPLTLPCTSLTSYRSNENWFRDNVLQVTEKKFIMGNKICGISVKKYSNTKIIFL